ncbi:isoprenoid biosynthesis protein ElbB, partial [bacterium]|nr:isoprenoid biosynthesis protein ElbB [bacterium]
SKGGEAVANEEVRVLLRDMHAAGKPIAALCIAPAMIAAAIGKDLSPQLTIGNDEGAAGGIEALGAKHVNCPVKEFVVDEKNLIVTTPAYMLGQNISEVAEGIEKTVAALLNMLED